MKILKINPINKIQIWKHDKRCKCPVCIIRKEKENKDVIKGRHIDIYV